MANVEILEHHRPPSNACLPLSERINIATQSKHIQLNRLILVRLPLALPPYTSNPSTYVSGLLHVAPVYITFESLWQTILDSPYLPTSLDRTAFLNVNDGEAVIQDSKCLPAKSPSSPIAYRIKVCPRTHSLLSHLRLPGLLRAKRLRADIGTLTGMPESEIEVQLDALSRVGKLAEFIAHTRKSVESAPHVLLAYAWVLYMALFSGGRYLRSSLAEAGGTRADFWNRDPSPVRPYSVTKGMPCERRVITSDFNDHAATRPSARSRSQSESLISTMIPGLQFFNFAGDADGEDIKNDFKKRITEAEVLLTNGEKEDIITEAEHIFKFMVGIISDLDRVMDRAMGAQNENIQSIGEPRPQSARQDIITVAYERLCKRMKTGSASQQKQRKPSYLEILVDNPVAKLVQYKRAFPTWNVIANPLSRPQSKERPSSESSLKPGVSPTGTLQLDSLWTKWLTSLMLTALCILLATWYYGM